MSNDLTSEIVKRLTQYTNEVKEEVEVAQEEVMKAAVVKLKSLTHPKLTGDYAKGWRLKKVGNQAVIHNKTNYQLTHLLEHGHAKDGGSGRVDPITHIKPVEKEVIKEFTDRVEEAIRR